MSVVSHRIDLEKRFLLWLVGLLALACVAYLALDAQRASFAATLVRAGVFGLAAGGIAHYLLFRPIRELLAVAKAVSGGDFSQRLDFGRQDEIGQLALAMDTLCDQLKAAQLASEEHIAALDQLRHSDRIATLGRLASSVAHELGNPLNVIELRAQLIASGDVGTLEHAQQSAAVIVEQSRRMTRIIDEILSFARMQPARIAPLDLVSVLRKAIVLSEHIAKKNRTAIVLNVPTATLTLDGDADKILQVIVNLLVNGVQAMAGGGTLTLGLREVVSSPVDDPEGAGRPYVCIEVTDQGVGMAPELMAKVFEPFVSTRSAHGGTGLGLSVAQGIAREHEGWISVVSELGRGSTFKVYLPKHGLRIANAQAS